MNQPFVIPEEDSNLIAAVHNGNVGHGGVDATMRKLAKAGHHRRRYMRSYVKHFIKQCGLCQKVAESHIAATTKAFTMGGGRPMQRVCIDTIGPVKPDRHGNKYIIALIDS